MRKRKGTDAKMELILWRHAEAEEAAPGDDDDARRLTARGKKQARQAARWLRERLPKDARILASPAVRARQTAEALGLTFDTDGRIGTQASAADVLAAAGWPHGAGTVLVVGHQPTLGQVAAVLLSGAEADWAIKKGAVWWFSVPGGNDGARATLKAAIGPDLL